MFDPKIIDTYDADDHIRRLYKWAIAKSMGGKPDNALKQMRYYVMTQLAERAILAAPAANIAEFGCWMGHSSLMLAQTYKRLVPTGQYSRFHIFDSFEGLSKHGPRDASKVAYKHRQYATSEEAFRALMSPYEFVEVHRGWIPAVFEGADIGQIISFANIDVNLYAPTKAALEFVWSRMINGGIIFFDDYGYHTLPGARKAVDEFLEELGKNPTLFVRLPFGSAFLVK